MWIASNDAAFNDSRQATSSSGRISQSTFHVFSHETFRVSQIHPGVERPEKEIQRKNGEKREKMKLRPHNVRETKISHISHTIGILVFVYNHMIIDQYWS